MKNNTEGPDIPLGLGLALAQNIDAMNKFSSLPQDKKMQMIEHTHQIRSKQEMKEYVRQFSEDSITFQ